VVRLSRRHAVIDRRTFLAGTGTVLLVAPLPAEAQPAGKVWRIGYLGGGTRATTPSEPFVQELRRLGWTEGKNLTIEYRWAEGGADRLYDLGREMATLNMDVIVVSAPSSSASLVVPTRTTPVVTSSFDRLLGAERDSPLRPLQNVTGVNIMAGELMAKQLQLLHEALPRARRVVVLRRKGNYSLGQLQEAATTLGLRLVRVEIGVPEIDELAAAGQRIAQEKFDAALVESHHALLHHRQLVVDLLAKSRLPTIFPSRDYVEAGGLMSYGPSTVEIQRQMARVVDRLLRGTKVVDLPIEQPRQFELVINLKTARALGLTMPQSLQLRADEVVQ
jgi:putative ABC transport system substrate-binding protein